MNTRTNISVLVMTETLFVKKHFNISFQLVPSANMEGEGLRSDTVASHQGENQVFFSGAVLLSFLQKIEVIFWLLLLKY